MEEIIIITEDSPPPYIELFRSARKRFQDQWDEDSNVEVSVAEMEIDLKHRTYLLRSAKGITRTAGKIDELLPLPGV